MESISNILLETFRKLGEQFSEFSSNFVGALVILLVGWLAAKLSSNVLDKVLSKVGIDKVGEKLQEIDAVKKLHIEIKLSRIVSKVVYFFIFLIFIITAADKLGIPAISNLFAMIVEFIPNVITAAILMVLGLLLSDSVRKFVESLCKSFNIASGKLIGMGVFAFLFLITIITALGQSGINTELLESSFNILIAGIVLSFSIGYGFASKEILHNIVSSFYSKNKYKEGQTIEIDGVKGVIKSIDNTTITLETEDSITNFPLKVLQSDKVVVYK
ncbi:Mechanosensitive ion channel [Spirosomataceae bacterium TFI 002]|nr:Mechanosensitive ion channel [Spirosomataceae bacterium TFI 002]